MATSFNIKTETTSYECSSKKHLLESLYAKDVKAPKGCHNGGCGVCRIKVLSGKYDSIIMNRKHISKEDEEDGIVLACRVFPRSDMEIEFIKKPKKNTDDGVSAYRIGY